MGLVATGSNFWHIQCDKSHCGKKLHHYGEELLKQSARLLGWEDRHNEWACPSCAERQRKRTERSEKSGRKSSHDLTA